MIRATLIIYDGDERSGREIMRRTDHFDSTTMLSQSVELDMVLEQLVNDTRRAFTDAGIELFSMRATPGGLVDG